MSGPRFPLACCVVLGFGLLSLAQGTPPAAAQEQKARPQVVPQTIVRDVFLIDHGELAEKLATPPSAEELQKRYPFESLEPRLKYEARRAASRSKRSRPALRPDAQEALRQAEELAGEGLAIRTKSLEILHSENVHEFISQQGLGVGRMVTFEPSPRYLPYPESPPLTFAAPPAESAGGHTAQIVLLPAEGVLEEGAGAWSPSQELLGQFHLSGQGLFASPASFGYVKDRRHVAGFRSHGFQWLPELQHPKNEYLEENRQTHPERWRISRLELVSLLKHEKPAVYVSEHLPRMNELGRAKTRALSEFERAALDKLLRGEQIVTTARANRIHMVGALRAAKDCQKCHQAEHGELLGAFSYDLFRDPPVKEREGEGPSA